MEEKVLYENGNVKVTSARFIVGNKTYQLGQINSSEPLVEKMKTPTLKYILMGLGILVSLAALGNMGESFIGAIVGAAFGGAIAYVGYKFINKPDDIYHVQITTSSGEASALSSTDSEHISNIVNAINDGLAMR